MREFGVSLTREEQEDASDYVRDILRDSKKEHDEVPTIIIDLNETATQDDYRPF